VTGAPESRIQEMKKYAVVFEKAVNNWAAYVPDLPGCVTTGSTLEEARRLIAEAIEFHIEGMRLHGEPVPEPTLRRGSDRSSGRLSCLMNRFVMQPHQLLGLQCHHRVRPTVVVAELNFVNARSPVLNHSADLAADQSLVGQILD
jgi:predicted RNase H-like HicB family nuclease